jgi:hypothetical protein
VVEEDPRAHRVALAVGQRAADRERSDRRTCDSTTRSTTDGSLRGRGCSGRPKANTMSIPPKIATFLKKWLVWFIDLVGGHVPVAVEHDVTGISQSAKASATQRAL